MSCCEQSNSFVSTVQVGKVVPDFSITTYDPVTKGFTNVCLDKQKKAGRWTVLFFYPADFTFVCPTELADLATKRDELDKMGVDIISVSTDTEFSHLAWRNSERLLENVSYKMGADPTGALAKMFGVYKTDNGLALRGSFVINPDGELMVSEVNFDNVGRNADELVRKISASIYTRSHPGEVCPARWKQGEKTLAPSEKIVGNVFDAMK